MLSWLVGCFFFGPGSHITRTCRRGKWEIEIKIDSRATSKCNYRLFTTGTQLQFAAIRHRTQFEIRISTLRIATNHLWSHN